MHRWIKFTGRVRRHKVLRKKISGTSQKPRISVYRSLTNLYTQVVNDIEGRTILSLATNSPSLKDKIGKTGGNVTGASLLGEALAAECKKKGIDKVVFDRGGYMFHGRIKAFAEAARKGGLIF